MSSQRELWADAVRLKNGLTESIERRQTMEALVIDGGREQKIKEIDISSDIYFNIDFTPAEGEKEETLSQMIRRIRVIRNRKTDR